MGNHPTLARQKPPGVPGGHQGERGDDSNRRTYFTVSASIHSALLLPPPQPDGARGPETPPRKAIERLGVMGSGGRRRVCCPRTPRSLQKYQLDKHNWGGQQRRKKMEPHWGEEKGIGDLSTETGNVKEKWKKGGKGSAEFVYIECENNGHRMYGM